MKEKFSRKVCNEDNRITTIEKLKKLDLQSSLVTHAWQMTTDMQGMAARRSKMTYLIVVSKAGEIIHWRDNTLCGQSFSLRKLASLHRILAILAWENYKKIGENYA